MKRLVKTFFSEDIVSAVFSLVIFSCAAIMIGWHISIGIRGTGLVLELLLGIGSFGLVVAVYKENKEDAESNGK